MDAISVAALLVLSIIGLNYFVTPEKANEINIIEVEKYSTLPVVALDKEFRIKWWRGIYEDEMLYAQRYYTKTLQISLGSRHLFVPYTNGFIKAFNKKNGSWEWSYNLGEIIVSGIKKHKNIILAGGEDGLIVALDNLNGKVEWQTNINDSVIAISSGKDRVYAYSQNGNTVAIDDKTGEVIWTYLGKEPNSNLYGAVNPYEYKNSVFIGTGNGLVIALKKSDGTIEWQRNIGKPRGFSDLERLVDVDSNFIVENNNLFVSSFGGDLISINLQNRFNNWLKKAPSISALQKDTIVAKNSNLTPTKSVVVKQNDGVISSYQIDTGLLIWKNKDLKYRRFSDLVKFQTYWITIDENGYVFAIDKQTGKLKYYYKSTQGISINSVADENYFYWLDKEGHLYSMYIDEKNKTNPISQSINF